MPSNPRRSAALAAAIQIKDLSYRYLDKQRHLSTLE
jgi:hypothetical protein